MKESKSMDFVNCCTHGNAPATFVCQHVLAGLAAKNRVGFFWTIEGPEVPRPDAWCLECEARVRKTDGEWVGEAFDKLQPKVLCGHCYDLAKIFHMGGSPWS